MSTIKNILLVSTADFWGGAEKVAAGLAGTYRARGLNVTLAVGFVTNETSQAVLIPNLERRNLAARVAERLVPLPSPSSLGQTLRIVRQTIKGIAEPGRAYAALMGRDDFAHPGTAWILEQAAHYDVVHLHNLHGGYFDLRMLPELCQIAPVVITAHDMWLATGHCAQPVDCTRWQTGCGSCPHLDFPPAVRADATHANFAAKEKLLADSHFTLCCPSEWMAESLSHSIVSLGASSTYTIYNGINTSIYHKIDKLKARRAANINENAFVFGFNASGEHSPYKDFATLSRVLDSPGLRSHQRSILALGIGGQAAVRTDGSLTIYTLPLLKSDREVAAALACCDVFVHTAKAEAAGLSVLEAQACGIPVIATKVGGVPEMMNPEGGVFVEASNDAAILKSLLELERDGLRRECMSHSAAQFGAQYSIKTMTDQYLEVYQRAREANKV